MDDLYPNDGTFFFANEPLDQAIDRKKERANTLNEQTELKKMIERLQARIDFYERNSSIGDDVRTDPARFLIVHNSYTLAANSLRSEKEYLEGLLDNAKRR